MCGIAGLINYGGSDRNSIGATLRRMTDAIAHRGPDGDGFWIDDQATVGLGHRRLAIIDLSETGAQPMASASGRYTITFNGEIYGFLQLREELQSRGIRFRGTSDTEVLLAAVETFGFEAAIRRLNGMFAFVLHDKVARKAIFVRDRLGKKPLYVGVAKGALAFGSELKSLRAHPAFARPEIDFEALTLFLRHHYIPAPYTIYSNVTKLPPGSWVAISVDSPPPSVAAIRASTQAYWRARDVAEDAQARRLSDEDEAIQNLDEALKAAVRDRLVSDVPVGAFLSGGIDSSLVAALMQECSSKPIKTYTVRFNEEKFNEADIALDVARRLKTDHSEIDATPAMALQQVDRLPEVYDEPFADPSQVPTLLVSTLARRNVTVALSGDGGDELFGGYSRYAQMMTFSAMAPKVPQIALRAVEAAPTWFLDVAFKLGRNLAPASLRAELSGDRAKKLASLLAADEFDCMYRKFLSTWDRPGELVIGGEEPESFWKNAGVPEDFSALERMMFYDTVTYLPDDVLAKVDRASMSVGLEMRAPLLDYRVVEAAWRAPRTLCLAGGIGKMALRRMLARRLPEDLIYRPKHGFSVPINDWLRGPLRGWAADLLSPARLRRDGFFRPAAIEKGWREHQSGERQWGAQMWTILMFNAWLDRWQR